MAGLGEIMRRFLVRKLRQWFGEWEASTSLEEDVERMREGLQVKRSAASFAMAREQDKRAELTRELAVYESSGREAEGFLRDGREDYARRSLARQLQSKAAIEKLRSEYTAIKDEAEESVRQYRILNEQVDTRLRQMPELKRDQRMITEQEKYDALAREHGFESAEQAFDAKAQQIGMRKREHQNRSLLDRDPFAELDREMRERLDEKELQQAMDALHKKVAAGDEIIEGEIVENDPVQQVERMLEAPRYDGLFNKPDTSRDTVYAERKNRH